uniref:L-threonylcarbamoyladenylate synthase n=1 Tax=Sphingomonas bacterium TaxID=1895847 RepID=UPI00266F9527
ISPTRAAHVAASLGGAVALIVDDGACAAGVESTIVADGRVLRPGPVTAEMVSDVLAERFPGVGRGPVESPSMIGVTSSDVPATGPRPAPGKRAGMVAPGQLASHYAPTKPLRLNSSTADPDEWLIGFGPIAGDDTLSASGDLHEAAARLFEALHRADSGAKPRIAVAPVPTTGIGAAIADRLRRAAHRD